MPTPPSAVPVPCPLLLGIPMDKCKKLRHFVQHCPLELEVCYLSTAEQEELLMQLLAAKDATRAPSPDKPALELTPEEINAYASLPELEEDF
ncbi:hypothetical protein C0989_004350 [Termitomyces sp. Mn162]|nr:hypothetical protein C0989_004350 [Termitomyces sp. Mn162]